MRSFTLRPLTILALSSAMTLAACGDDGTSGETDVSDTTDTTDTTDATDDASSTSTSTTETGDGDGDAGDGDGDTGDGDGDTGDGDGDTGDGDGDTGDGDGDTGDGDGDTGDGDGDTGDGDGDTGDGDGDTGDGDGDGDQSVYDIACNTVGYESLCAAVDKAGLAATLDDASGTFTVFAPDNDAFTALLGAIGAASLDDVTAEQLTPILLYHVLETEVDSVAATSAAENDQTVDALGGTIQLGINGSSIELDATALVEAPDLTATNGIVHGISAVILPSVTDVVVSDDNFSSLEAALGLADTDASAPNLVGTLDDNDGTFTVFAPTNDAFTGLIGALPTEAGISGLADITSTQVLPILRYHVVAGAAVTAANVADGPIGTLGGNVVADTSSGVTIDSATVTTADLYTANGVIHVIDGVLVPSIADTVTTAPEFEQLAGLVTAADGDATTTPKLGAALDGAAPAGAWTVFAPTNDAITTLVGALSPNVPSSQSLTDIILYHAINGAAPGVFASAALGLTDASVPTALLGLPVTVNGGTGVTVAEGAFGAAEVVTTDYLCANGVIHAIDDVLVPSTTGSSTNSGETFGSGAFPQDVCVDVIALDVGTVSASPTVTVALDHSLAGDLTIEVTSPDGTTVTVMEEPGTGPLGQTSNLSATFPIRFRAGAAVSAADMGASIAGDQNICEDDGECMFAPDPDDLDSFVGEAANGTWEVCILDGNGTVGSGTLSSVGVTVPFAAP